MIDAHAVCGSGEAAFLEVVENKRAKRYVGRDGHDARKARARETGVWLESVVLEIGNAVKD